MPRGVGEDFDKNDTGIRSRDFDGAEFDIDDFRKG